MSMEALPLPLVVGKPSGTRLQLRPGSRSKRAGSSSRPGTAKTQLPRSQSESKSEDIPRASSVPLLLDNHVNLEIHSTPVSLTTRSLSNHLTTTSALRPSSTKTVRGGKHDWWPRRTTGSTARDQNTQSTDRQSHNNLASAATGCGLHKPKSGRALRRGNIAAQFSGKASVEHKSLDISNGVDVKQEQGLQQTATADVVITQKGEESAPVIKESLQIEEAVEGEEGEMRWREEREAAVRNIQRWYRRCRERKQARVAEIKCLLQEKREELDRSRSEQQRALLREEESREREEEQRKKRRQEKLQASRQAAIQTLHQRREEKKRQRERLAQEEIVLLQASGKIKRCEKQMKKKRKREERVVSSSKQLAPEQVTDPPSQTVPDSVITEFFEAGSSRKSLPKASSHAAAKTSASISPRHTSPALQVTSTYTDILDTLKLLEEAPPPLSGSKSQPTNQRSKSNDNYFSLSNPGYLSSASFGQREVGVATTSSSLSESKLQSILSYLDEMERADGELVTQLSQRRDRQEAAGKPVAERETEQMTGPSKGSDLGEELQAATDVATDVTTTILTQRMELDSKNKTVEMLQKALSQQRELTVYHAKEMEKEGQRRLELQKQEYETTIQRHQCFIDQLIEDKKTLSERCEQLVKDLRETSTKYQTKLKNLEETHAAELSKVRQVAAAADKLRREKWRTEESQKIKEATVRSLEPEIQRIIAKGKADIQRLKTLHEAELLQADERAGRRFVAQMEELRAQCAKEKEQACAHERELARQRYEKLAEQEEMSAQQQRRKLFAELQLERDKMAAQWEQQRRELEQQQADSQAGHTQELEEVYREHSRAMEEAERRHSSQLKAVEERLSTEREAWQENFTRKQETTFLSREREMRESLRQERDKEIEMVINRLEAEAEAARVQNEKTTEARIKRTREKFEAELAEVERSERSTQEKLTFTKQELGEREGEVARLRSLLRQKDEEVCRVGEVATKLSKERDNVTDVVRQEFADRLVSTEEENKRIKIEMSELRARHRLELEQAQRDKERELEEVHTRVRQALVKKEENLSSLRSQHEAALKRADHLEMLLERQRRELLKK